VASRARTRACLEAVVDQRLALRVDEHGETAPAPAGRAPQVADTGAGVAQDLDRPAESHRLGVDLLETLVLFGHEPIVAPAGCAGQKCDDDEVTHSGTGFRSRCGGTGRGWPRRPPGRVPGVRTGSRRWSRRRACAS